MNKPGAIIIEGHVQGLSNLRSLGEAGIPVYVVDKTNCIARYSRYCQKFFRCPEYNSDKFAVFLMELAVKESINGWVLLPSNDHAVYTISRHKKILEDHFKMITPGLDIIEIIYDKSKLLHIADKCGIPIPATHYFTSFDEVISENISFPVITKGKNGLSFYKTMGIKALFASDVKELRSQLRFLAGKVDIQRTMTQELIPDDGTNKTLSFTAFCVHGEIKAYWMGEKLRQHPIRFGTATFANSVYVEECYQQSIPLLKALNYTGVCEVEYLRDPRDGLYKLIEINARTWLWVSLARRCGIDFPLMIYNYLNSKSNNFPKDYRQNVKWVHIWTDLFFSIKGVIKKKYTISEILKTYNGKKEFAVFSLKDIKPFIFETIKLPYIALTR